MSETTQIQVRPGDSVLVRMKVHHIGRNGCLVGYGFDEHGMRAHPDDVVSVEERPFAVGDQVLHKISLRRGEIICLHGRCAWVVFDRDTEGSTAELQYLVRP